MVSTEILQFSVMRSAHDTKARALLAEWRAALSHFRRIVPPRGPEHAGAAGALAGASLELRAEEVGREPRVVAARG